MVSVDSIADCVVGPEIPAESRSLSGKKNYRFSVHFICFFHFYRSKAHLVYPYGRYAAYKTHKTT